MLLAIFCIGFAYEILGLIQPFVYFELKEGAFQIECLARVVCLRRAP